MEQQLHESALDYVFAYQFIKKLTTDFKDTDAFKTGVIDKDGELLVKSADRTSEQKKAYDIFDRLVFNIKRMIHKYVPFGSTRLARYSTALYLIKEHKRLSIEDFGVVERLFVEYLEERYKTKFDTKQQLQEERRMLPQKGDIRILNEDIMLSTGEQLKRGEEIQFLEEEPYDEVLGAKIFRAKHIKSKQDVLLTIFDVLA